MRGPTRIRLIRDAQLEAHTPSISKNTLSIKRHEREIAQQKTEWQALSIERKRLWQQWEAEFGQRPRQTAGTGSGGQGDSQAPSPAPRRPRQYFADTAEPIKKEAPKAADSQVKAEFDPAAKPDNPPPKPGWKQRRSAAERKADGTYKPRQRKAPKPRL